MPPQPHSPPDSLTKRSASSPDVTYNQQNDPNTLDGDDTQMAVGRSSSDEKESLTPAQSKRKAQNRAAYVLNHYFYTQDPPKKERTN